MLVWFIFAPLNILCMLVCYLTNWFVCLFADEYGELPCVFRLWQTWDDTLNPRFYIKEHVPSFLRYDYDKHYQEYFASTPELVRLGRKRCFVKIINPHFTLKERIQRYICRVMWLYRNCGYGFAFYVFGREANGATYTYTINKKDACGHYERCIHDTNDDIISRAWSFKSTWPITKHLRWEVYLGWKIDPDVDKECQCMIANRIAFRSLD